MIHQKYWVTCIRKQYFFIQTFVKNAEIIYLNSLAHLITFRWPSPLMSVISGHIYLRIEWRNSYETLCKKTHCPINYLSWCQDILKHAIVSIFFFCRFRSIFVICVRRWLSSVPSEILVNCDLYVRLDLNS